MTQNITYNLETFTLPERRPAEANVNIRGTTEEGYVINELFYKMLPSVLERRPAEANADICGTTEEGYVINELFYEMLPSVPEKDTENMYEPMSPLHESGEGLVANGDFTNEPVHDANHTQPIKVKETGKGPRVTAQQPHSAEAKELLTGTARPHDPACEAYYVINQLN